MTGGLQELLLERIATTGPMPFAAFMQTALYHPRFGYYAAGAERTGWRGHFLTSPELDPGFGELWARGFEEIWEASGRPAEFHVVEVGPGEGAFAEAVLGTVGDGFADALHYSLVERVGRVEERQRARLSRFDRVSWAPSIMEVDPTEHGIVFANEVLDNLPVHLVEMRAGELWEVCVEARDGRLAAGLRPPSSPELAAYVARCGIEIPDRHRFEIGLAAESFVAHAAATFERGGIVIIDYGASAGELATRSTGSLLCYSDSGTDEAVLERPGEKDITAHVNWTAVAGACERRGLVVSAPRSQRSVLRALGIGELDRRSKDVHDVAIAEGRGADAVGALSRRQALGALADPMGLGGLDVLTAWRGPLSPPSWIDPNGLTPPPAP